MVCIYHITYQNTKGCRHSCLMKCCCSSLKTFRLPSCLHSTHIGMVLHRTLSYGFILCPLQQLIAPF
uniref:Putative ovule protein n=1 Tax=Solanum chacoense TaxID=4108 RepID=A0A0V0H8S1_SOLCH